jgi:alpha-beta hydrolase superfamily lysophospholipase
VQIGIVRAGERSTRAAALQPRPRETSPYADVIYDSVAVRGARRRTIVTRPHRSGRLPAVMFMQGLGCYSLDNTPRSEGYGAVISALEQRGIVTMRVEKTGEGDSEGPACSDPGSLPDLEAAGWLAGLRALKQYDFVDPEKVFVFAHSMGPVTGSLWLGEEKVRGFMAVETVGKSWFEYDIERMRVQVGLRLPPDEVDREVRAYEICSHRFYIDKHKPDELAKEGCSDVLAPFGAVPYTYMQAVADISLGKQWKSADFPVLVVYGTSSPVTTAEESRYLAEIINKMHAGRATYLEVPGMSHDLGRYESQRAYMERGNSAGPFHTGLIDSIVKWMESVAGPLL